MYVSCGWCVLSVSYSSSRIVLPSEVRLNVIVKFLKEGIG